MISTFYSCAGSYRGKHKKEACFCESFPNVPAGIRLQGDWGEIVAPEGSKSPWEALRATKTLPLIFATFEKASTCAKRTFVRRNPVKIEQTY